MRKWNLILLVLALTLGILGACNNSSNSSGGSPTDNGQVSNDNSGSNKTTNETDNDNKLSGEITVWAWGNQVPAMQKAVPGFNQKYPDVKVNIVKLGSDDVKQKLTVGLGAGGKGLPDISALQGSDVRSIAGPFPNGFLDLKDYGFNEIAKDWVPSKIKEVTLQDGKIIGFPWDAGPVVVYYRADLFKKANVDPDSIKTWSDYIEAGKKIKAATGVKMSVLETDGDTLFRIMIHQQGLSYFNSQGDITLTSDKAARAMSTLKKINDAGLFVKAKGSTDFIAAVKNGKVATVVSAVWWQGRFKQNMQNLKGKWKIFKIPVFKEGGMHAANYGGSDLLVLSSSKNKKAAVAFAKYFTHTKEPQMRAFKDYGMFPSLTTTYNDPFYNQPSDYFSGQPVNQVFSEVAKKAEPSIFTKDSDRGNDIIVDTRTAFMNGKYKSAKDALTKAANRLASVSKRKIAQ